MPNTKLENNKKIAFVMLAIMAFASVLSFGSRKVFAQNTETAATVGLLDLKELFRVLRIGMENMIFQSRHLL